MADEQNQGPGASIFARRDGVDENEPAKSSDVNAAQDQAEALSQESEQRAEGAELVEGVPEDDEVQFTSHPIQRFRLGKFQFDKGLLRVSGEDRRRFERLLEHASPRTKSRVRQIDVSGANKVASGFASSRRNRGVDTSRPGPSGGAA